MIRVNHALAMLFSLLLAVAPLWGAGAAAACPPAGTVSCCDSTCADCACCVTASRAPGAPLNEASLPARAAEQTAGIPATTPAWPLPAAPASGSGFSLFASPVAASFPIFLRHCLLLI